MAKVFLNPGHCPGVDPGAVNTEWNITEADIVREVGTLVKKYLETAGCEVMLLQSNNLAGEVSGENVCATANYWPADIFISLHCNAFDGSAQGTETCVYSKNDEGAHLGQCLQNQLVNSLGTVDRGLKERPGLIVLKYTDMPAALVELGFIDNAHDADILMNYKDTIARAIARGITDYLSGQ